LRRALQTKVPDELVELVRQESRTFSVGYRFERRDTDEPRSRLMKLPPIIGLILCVSILPPAQAQRAESSRGPTVEPVRTADIVDINPGKLRDVVKSLEERRPDADRGKPWLIPNVIFAPGTEEAQVPAPMRLLRVSPAQALALIAAAAGCDLEPLYAPPEEGGPTDTAGNSDFALQKIIGYRVTRRAKFKYGLTFPAAAPSVNQSEELGGVGITLTQQNDKLIVNDVIEGMPASRSKAVKAGDRLLAVTDPNGVEVNVSTVPMQKATELVRGEPGTSVKLKLAPGGNENQLRVVELTREKLARSPQEEPTPAVTGFGPGIFAQSTPPAIHPPVLQGTVTGDLPRTIAALPGADMTPGTPTVRIYALGTILDGPSDEASLAKENNFRELIAESLAKGDRDRKNPDLSFHKASRVLIAKATAAQHEIIQQLVAAMRENETVDRPTRR
jgi:hypothetical protein